MIIKFNDFLNESKKVKEPINFRMHSQEYRKRIFNVIDGILPQEERYIKVYHDRHGEKEEISSEIRINPIVNDREDGYDVHISLDIYGMNEQLISISINNPNSVHNPVWKNHYDYRLDTETIDKLVKLIKSLVNFTGKISSRDLDKLIDSIYIKLSKK